MSTRNYSSYDEDSSNDSNSYFNPKYVSIDFDDLLFQEQRINLKYDTDLKNKPFSNANENFQSAFNQVFISREEETETDNENEKRLFSIEHFNKRKRGRFTSNKTKREEHNKYTKDNVIRKIQTHYLSFIIDFINMFLLKKKEIFLKILHTK